MKNIYQFIHKFFIIIFSLGLAIVCFSVLSLNQNSRAQTSEPESLFQMPSDSSVNKDQTNAKNDQGVIGQAVELNNQPKLNENLKSNTFVEGVPNNNPRLPYHVDEMTSKILDKTGFQPPSSKAILDKLRYTMSYIGDPSNDEPDPFRKPIYLLEIEEEALRPQTIDGKFINEKVEAIRRWPLLSYHLIGIIWDVQNPKVMITDPNGKLHLLKRNYRIGDRGGIITSILEGSMTVIQDGVPVVVPLNKK